MHCRKICTQPLAPPSRSSGATFNLGAPSLAGTCSLSHKPCGALRAHRLSQSSHPKGRHAAWQLEVDPTVTQEGVGWGR